FEFSHLAAPYSPVVGCQPMARVFSGIQPSGELHIGNYLGAVQHWVKLQRQHDCLFCVVDLHAITQPYEASSLSQRTIDMAVGLYAVGLDPQHAIVFVQSHVPEHTELNWLLNTVTPLGELERQTQFKDKAQRQASVAAGLLNYPVLQAADVLLYRATLVPVGEDQLEPRDPGAGRAQLSHCGLGLPRLQTRAGGQYDSRARSRPRAGAGASGGAERRARDVARGRGEGAGARPRDHDAGAPLHGPARR